MERKTQTGYLVLADISGYTSYVAQTEIEHADMALSYLLETIVEKIGSLLVIGQLEGDAVFAYAEEGKLKEGKSLLELIDQTYLAFREKALELYAGATCPCRACKALPKLDLKFMVLRLSSTRVAASQSLERTSTDHRRRRPCDESKVGGSALFPIGLEVAN